MIQGLRSAPRTSGEGSASKPSTPTGFPGLPRRGAASSSRISSRTRHTHPRQPGKLQLHADERRLQALNGDRIQTLAVGREAPEQVNLRTSIPSLHRLVVCGILPPPNNRSDWLENGLFSYVVVSSRTWLLCENPWLRTQRWPVSLPINERKACAPVDRQPTSPLQSCQRRPSISLTTPPRGSA